MRSALCLSLLALCSALDLTTHVPISISIPKPKGRKDADAGQIPRHLLKGPPGGGRQLSEVPSVDDNYAQPHPRGLAVDGEESPLDSATVMMCVLDWATYRSDPTATPMFRDLLARSGCDKGAAGKGARSAGSSAIGSVITVPFTELEAEYNKRGCRAAAAAAAPSSPVNGCVPSGMVFHESRCGSTLVANMLAVLPDSVVYSESSPPWEVLHATHLSEDEKVRALRVLVAGMGRPIAAAAAATGSAPAGSELAWVPLHLYFKFQSALSLHIGTVRAAFPTTPWSFIHRDGTEVLASLFRGATLPPPSDASISQHVSGDDQSVRRAPCMRNRDSGAHPLLLAITNTSTTNDAYHLPPEEYCAASVALLAGTAVQQARIARRAGLAAVGLLTTPQSIAGPSDASAAVTIDVGSGRDVARLAAAGAATSGTGAGTGATASSPSPSSPIVAVGGLLLDAATGSGVIGGVGQAVFIEYTSLPEAVAGLVQGHYGLGRLSDDSINRMLEVGGKYSKARGNTGNAVSSSSSSSSGSSGDGSSSSSSAGTSIIGRLRATLERVASSGGSKRGGNGGRGGYGPSMDGEGKYVDDSGDKQSRAWPALKAAARKYLTSLRGEMLRFNTPVEPSGAGATATGTSSSGPAGSSTDGSASQDDADTANNNVGGAVVDAAVGSVDEDALLEAMIAASTAATSSTSSSASPQGQQQQQQQDGGLDAAAARPMPGPLAALAAGLIGTDVGRLAAASSAASSAAGSTGGSPSAGTSTTSASTSPLLHQQEAGYDQERHQLPLGGGYPMLFPLSTILGEWSSDIVSVPPTYGRYSSLKVFNWGDERERAEANRYRWVAAAGVVFVAVRTCHHHQPRHRHHPALTLVPAAAVVVSCCV